MTEYRSNINFYRCYPQVIREKQEKRERDELAARIADLVVEKLRRVA